MLKGCYLLLPLFIHLSYSIEEIWSLEEDFPDWKDRACEAERIPILGLLPTRTRTRWEFKQFIEFKKELEKSSEEVFEFGWTADDVQYEWYQHKKPAFVIYVDYDKKNGSHIGCEKSRSFYLYKHDQNPRLMAGWVKIYAFPYIIEMQAYEKHTEMILHVSVPKLWIYRREGFTYPDFFIEVAKKHRGNIMVITTKVRPEREGEVSPISWQPGGWGLELDFIVARFRYGGYIDDKSNVMNWIAESLKGVAEAMDHGRALGLEGTARWEEFLQVESHKAAVEVNAKYKINKDDDEEITDLSEDEDGDLLDPEVKDGVNVREHDEL